MDLNKIFDEDLDNVEKNILGIVNNSVNEAREMQKKKVAENVQIVIDALKKIEQNIKEKYDFVGNQLEKRIVSIKDGRDGINGRDGKNGKDGKQGNDGRSGRDGKDGKNGLDGQNGEDGVSVVNAHIDFDGSLIISLSSGKEINVGEVVAPALAEQIKVITNGGGTSQSVLDTLTSLQSQIDALSGATIYKGLWNASTNSPALTSSVGTSGNFYIVSVAGSTSLDGITNWGVGDWAIFNGSVWQRVEGGAAGNFTTLTATGGGSLTGTWSSLGTVTTVDINGGTIDGTAIGGTTPAAGAFTTLSASGAVTVTTSTAAISIVNNSGVSNAWLSVDNTSIGGKVWRVGDGISTPGKFYIYNQTDNSFPIEISTAGVAVTGTLSATYNTGSLQLTSSTGTNPAYVSFVNTGGTSYIGPTSSGGGGILTGGNGYYLTLAAAAGYGIDFGIGSTKYMTLSSTGLAVTGTLTTSGAAGLKGASVGTGAGALFLDSDESITWATDSSSHSIMKTAAFNGLVYEGYAGHKFTVAGTDRVVIDSTGLAVTGTLSATGTITSTSSAIVLRNNAAGTTYKELDIGNTGNSVFLGVEGSPTTLIAGATAYDSFISTATGTGFVTAVNFVTVTRATSTGLAVTGTLSATGLLTASAGLTSTYAKVTATYSGVQEANKGEFAFTTGNVEFYSYGPNAATPGGYAFITRSSNASVNVTPVTISSTGLAVTGSGTSTYSDGATYTLGILSGGASIARIGGTSGTTSLELMVNGSVISTHSLTGLAVTGTLSAEGEIISSGASAALSIDRRDTGAKKWVLYSAAGEFNIYNNVGGAIPLTIADAAANNTVSITSTGLAVTGTLSSTGNLTVTGGYIEGNEQTAPAAPAANGYRIYAEDNGAGKTRLMVKFATGAAQQIAIEP